MSPSLSVLTVDAAAPDLVLVGNVYWVSVDQIEANPFQPRQTISEETLLELGDSIREHGVLQPILVRPIEGKRYKEIRYQLVCGERRWRASMLAGKAQVPAVVRSLSDLEAQEIALDENIQRESLTDYEEAVGIGNLFKAYEETGTPLSKSEMARRRGKSYTFIDNRMKLLVTRPDVQEVAARHRLVLTSCLEINKISEETTRRELLAMVDAGDSYQDVMAHIAKYKAEAARQSQAQTAPDAQTQQRAAAVARGESGSISRGIPVTSSNARQARSEVERALSSLRAWWPELAPDDAPRQAAALCAFVETVSASSNMTSNSSKDGKTSRKEPHTSAKRAD